MRLALLSITCMGLLARAIDPAGAASIERFDCTANLSWFHRGQTFLSSRCPATMDAKTPILMQLVIAQCSEPRMLPFYKNEFTATPSSYRSQWQSQFGAYAMSLDRSNGDFHYVHKNGDSVSDIFGQCTVVTVRQAL